MIRFAEKLSKESPDKHLQDWWDYVEPGEIHDVISYVISSASAQIEHFGNMLELEVSRIHAL